LQHEQKLQNSQLQQRCRALYAQLKFRNCLNCSFNSIDNPGLSILYSFSRESILIVNALHCLRIVENFRFRFLNCMLITITRRKSKILFIRQTQVWFTDLWKLLPRCLITAGTLVPAVLMATSRSYGNGQTFTTHRIRTP